MVMLKNAGGALPLSRAPKRLAVIGPLADAPAEMRGLWWGAAPPDGHVSVLEGLRSALPQTEILHSQGVDIESDDCQRRSQAASIFARRPMPSSFAWAKRR